jgi:hypothetical protein
MHIAVKVCSSFVWRLSEPINDEFRRLLSNGVKQGRLAIPNLVLGASRLHQASKDSAEQLVESLIGNGKLNNEEHAKCVRKGSALARLEQIEASKAILEEVAVRGGVKVQKRLERLDKTGAWLGCCPDRFSGTVLTYTEWFGNLNLCYGLGVKNLPTKCNGCGFSAEMGSAVK